MRRMQSCDITIIFYTKKKIYRRQYSQKRLHFQLSHHLITFQIALEFNRHFLEINIHFNTPFTLGEH